MKKSLLLTIENEESVKKTQPKTQHSLRRIKAIFSSIARRKANDQRGKELWYAGYRR